MQTNFFLHAGDGSAGAPENGAAAPGVAVAVTTGVAAVGMPKVRLDSGGIVTPATTVGAGPADDARLACWVW